MQFANLFLFFLISGFLPKSFKTKLYGVGMNKLLITIILVVSAVSSYSQVKLDDNTLNSFEFRNFGAHRVGSWLGSVAVPDNPGEKYKYTFFASPRNGGVFKTTNGGTTFYPVFDKYGVNTIGDIAIAQSDPDVVWVGTGDSYNSRSTYAGNGIYKSTDGGETFNCMGLKDSYHIVKILIHPKDKNTVYAASMGHLYSSNEERGVFKTTDGGKTWNKILYINEKTGVIDIIMNPKNPDMIFASAYEKYRYPWHFEAGGTSSGVYKTSDGGKNWTKLSGGLPSGTLGRIGLSLCMSNPAVVYALVENLNPKDPSKPLNTQGMMNTYRDDYYDQLLGGELYRSDDYGATWKKTNDPKVNLSNKAAYSFNRILADPNDENKIFVLGVSIFYSFNGGKDWKGINNEPNQLFPNMFGDVRTMWIDPKDSRHLMVGSDGGLYESFDGGKTTIHHYNIPGGEFYTVEADTKEPYYIYGGLQDHEIWRAPSNNWSGEIALDDWTVIGAGDGMYIKIDSSNRYAYFTGQFGQQMKADMNTGKRKNIMPAAPKGKPAYRYTWDTPLIISPHNNNTIYTGAQMLLRSTDAGETWVEVSPDLTTNDSIKSNGRGHIKYCTITTISESPVKAGIIWAATDDGRVHYTSDNGKTWNNCTEALTKAGAPADYWCTSVLASYYNPGTAYIAKSGYTRDVFTPYLFKTTDYGKTWKSISSNLPMQSVNVICEDRNNPQLLFAGTDGGLFVTINGGERWEQFKQLPPVPVKDVMIHKRENDLLAATYGRGIYVADISPLKEMKENFFNSSVYLFNIEPKPLQNYSDQSRWGNRELMGNKHIAADNEPNGLRINYYLKDAAKDTPKIEIFDSAGKSIKTIQGKKTAGLNSVLWGFDKTENNKRAGMASPGNYKVVLTVDGKDISKTGTVKPAWIWPAGNQNIN